jgi:probable HAF family extracellular repeat protein
VLSFREQLMTAFRLFFVPRVAVVLLPLLLLSNCDTDTPTAPGIRDPAAAAGGGPEPTVRSTVPSASPRDTSISVLVQGSGFDHDSRAVWALKGDTTFTTTKIHVSSTTFVNSKELIADLTIGADAPLDRYDVQVLTSSGKKGIGIERFEVTQDITTLPTLVPDAGGAIAINDAGTVVGSSWVNDRFYAVRWKRRGHIWTIEQLPGPTNDTQHASAYDIADDGTIIGNRFYTPPDDGDQESHATVWPISGGWVDLGLGSALSVSANGTVVGSRFDFNNSGPFNNQAVVWSRISGRKWDQGRLLPRLPNGHGTVAQAINQGGNVVVGFAADAQDVQHAVRWRSFGGEWQSPTVLDGREGSVMATSVNASGDVAGMGWPCDIFAGCSVQMMFWPSTGGRVDLGTLGVSESVQYNAGLSNSGEVVGIVTTPEFRQYAFVWRPKAGTVADLGNLLGDEGSEARDINNHRQVVGSSYGPRGYRPVLWRVR